VLALTRSTIECFSKTRGKFIKAYKRTVPVDLLRKSVKQASDIYIDELRIVNLLIAAQDALTVGGRARDTLID
jgi:hypothetical protein